MLTLLQIMTLDDWTDIARTYMFANLFATFLVITFMILSALILMNLLSAIFVDKLMQLTDENRVRENEKIEAKKQEFATKLRSVFSTFDDNGDGMLTEAELSEGLSKMDTNSNGTVEPSELAKQFENSGLGQKDLDDLIKYISSINSNTEAEVSPRL